MSNNAISPSLVAARAQTLAAATTAREAKLISEKQFDRMTDGTVSQYDIFQATKTLEDCVAIGGDSQKNGAAAIMKTLQAAFNEQVKAQPAQDFKNENKKDYLAASYKEVWSTLNTVPAVAVVVFKATR